MCKKGLKKSLKSTRFTWTSFLREQRDEISFIIYIIQHHMALHLDIFGPSTLFFFPLHPAVTSFPIWWISPSLPPSTSPSPYSSFLRGAFKIPHLGAWELGGGSSLTSFPPCLKQSWRNLRICHGALATKLTKTDSLIGSTLCRHPQS